MKKDELIFDEPENDKEGDSDTGEDTVEIPHDSIDKAFRVFAANVDEDHLANVMHDASVTEVVIDPPEIDEKPPISHEIPARYSKATRRMGKVLDRIEAIISDVSQDDDVRGRATQAAKLLNKILDRHHDESNFKVGTCLTGLDPVFDAAVLEANNINEAIDDEWDFEDIVAFAWESAKIALDGIKTIRLIFGG